MLTSVGLVLLKTALRGPIDGRERVLCLSGHDDSAAACAGKQMAMRRPRVLWAVLDGAESWRWLLLAATGGSAIAEVAGVGEARRHRHLRPSKRACGALDRKA